MGPPGEIMLHLQRDRDTTPALEMAFVLAETLKEWARRAHAGRDVAEVAEPRAVVRTS
jgi:hypothetical protein